MTNAEITGAVLAATAEITETDIDILMSKSRTREIVDARHIAIKVMHDMGLYVRRIAAYLGVSERNIHYALTGFEMRLRGNPMMRNNYEEVRNEMRKRLEKNG